MIQESTELLRRRRELLDIIETNNAVVVASSAALQKSIDAYRALDVERIPPQPERGAIMQLRKVAG